MGIEYEIYQVLVKKQTAKFELTNQICDGISAYASSTGLDEALKRCPADKRQKYIESFMRPILNMPAVDIPIYFKSYALRFSFTRVANKIHDESEKLWRDGAYVCDNLPALTQEFHSLLSQIRQFPELDEVLGWTISNCYIELEYLAGRSRKISQSLQERVGVDIGTSSMMYESHSAECASPEENGQEMLLRLHNMVLHTKALGPGMRTAIWFQGCRRNCKGCMSPDSRPLDGGRLVPVEAIVRELAQIKNIEGVTISGGEPFLQIQPLYHLLTALREQLELGIIIYTGYTLEALRSMQDPYVESILSKYVDILIDGEYVDDLNDGIALRGSSNQCVHFLSERYLSYADMYKSPLRNVEVVASNKEFFLIGIPPKKTLEEWGSTIHQLRDTEEDH